MNNDNVRGCPSMLGRVAWAIGLAASLAAPALAQQPAAPVTLTVHPLRGGIYWVTGGVSNGGFVVGDKGVVVIDSQKSPDAAQQEVAAIAKITPKPIDTIIVTHADPDHVGGLAGYPAGATIIAQENTRSEMQASAADPSGGPLTAAYKDLVAHHLPSRTIGNTETVTIDGVRMVLMYVAPAHTDGDLIIYLPAQKVVFGGDIILTNAGPFPVIHLGGSSLGWINAMKAILALDADTYISGHGANETKAQLQARLHFVEQRREQIKAMVYQNKSVAEILQALPEPESNPLFLTFAETVSDELTNGYPTANPPWKNIIHRAQ